jgi:hypothetical protein
MFDIGNGRVVDLWSNGAFGPGAADYGVAVATSALALDYLNGGVVAAVPEPGSLWLFACGVVVSLYRCRRTQRLMRAPR